MKFEKLGNIAKVVSGSTPKTNIEKYWNGDIPWVTPKEISQVQSTYLNETERKLTREGFKSCSTSIIPKGNILFTSRAPIGLIAINNIDVCTNQGFKSVILNDGYSSLYVYYYLKSKVQQINNLGAGTTFKELSKSTFEKFEIPVTDYQTQLHIANILSKSESLLTQRKESIRLLDEYLKSVFLEMFGDPVRNEKGWKINKIISFADCIVPGRDKPKSFTGDIPWLTTEDLNHLSFSTKSNKNIALSQAEIEQVRARLIPSGSVLMTCVGDLGIISINKTDCVVNQQLHTFQCKEGMNNIFLMFALSLQKGYMYKTASTTTVPYMNKTICNSIPVFQPPLELQTQFAQIVEKTEALKAQYQQSLQELENLYGSLIQKAFKGELSIKDENLLMAAEPETKYGDI